MVANIGWYAWKPIMPQKRKRHCRRCPEPISANNKTGLSLDCRVDRDTPAPSEAEIKSQCAKIRSEWSKAYLAQQEGRRRVEVVMVKRRGGGKRAEKDD
jgi:hypothetical protein